MWVSEVQGLIVPDNDEHLLGRDVWPAGAGWGAAHLAFKQLLAQLSEESTWPNHFHTVQLHQKLAAHPAQRAAIHSTKSGRQPVTHGIAGGSGAGLTMPNASMYSLKNMPSASLQATPHWAWLMHWAEWLFEGIPLKRLGNGPAGIS